MPFNSSMRARLTSAGGSITPAFIIATSVAPPASGLASPLRASSASASASVVG